MTDPVAFIRANTALEAPPLVPEITLYLASAVTPLWQATEATMERESLPPPYWAFAWPGGQALARHILDHPALVRGLCVLDFGAGSGLVAIAAAKAGAAQVAAAEIDPFALAAIALNAAENGVAIEPIADNILPPAAAPSRYWDVILLGDMCYEKPLADRLLPWLKAQTEAGATVLLGDPGRAYLPAAGLERIATYTVPTTLDLEDRTERETGLWRFSAR